MAREVVLKPRHCKEIVHLVFEWGQEGFTHLMSLIIIFLLKGGLIFGDMVSLGYSNTWRGSMSCKHFATNNPRREEERPISQGNSGLTHPVIC